VIAATVLAACRYPVFLLAPIVGFLATCGLLVGLVQGVHPGAIGIEVLGSIVAPQLAYLAITLTAHLARSVQVMPQVQAAIGKELRVELEVPRRLPPELAVLVRQLHQA
jgi:hypothetical protein